MAQAAQVIEAALPDAFAGDAHSLLVAIYKDVSRPIELRIDAAKAAIRYETPALAAVEHSTDPDKPIGITFQTVFESKPAK